MDEAEFKRVNKQLDRLDDRVRKVIARRTPLQLDHSGGQRTIRAAPPPCKPLPKVQRKAFDYTSVPPIASGQLTGHEMAWPEYEPPGCSQDERKGFDFMRDVIFAEFNR